MVEALWHCALPGNESLWSMYRNQHWTHFPHLKFCNDLMHNGFCMSQYLRNHSEKFQTIKLQKRFIFRNIIESSRACWTINALFVIDALCSVFKSFVPHTQFSLWQRTLTVGFLLHNKYFNNYLSIFRQKCLAYRPPTHRVMFLET